MSKAKYNSKKIVINGTEYDSIKESRRGEELKMLERSGIISELQFQVPFLLQPSFKINGKVERKIEYFADAVYIENGIKIVEDTKSDFTRKLPVFRIKKKLLLFKHIDIVFREYI